MKKNILQKTKVVFLSFGYLVIMQSCEENLTTSSQTDLDGVSVLKATTLTVDSCNFLHQWKPHVQGTVNKLYFDFGPPTPPMGIGSLYIDATEKKFVRWGNNSFVGQYIKYISKLSYSTYIENSESFRDNIFLVIQLDVNNDDVADFPIVYVPYYQSGEFVPPGGYDQGPMLPKTWQTWDCVKGYWFQGDFVNQPVDPEQGGKQFTLIQWIKKYPNATIQVNGTVNNFALRLAGGGGNFGANFKGRTDNFHIKTKLGDQTFDFEKCQP